MAIGANSAAHEMLRILEKRGGSMKSTDLRDCDVAGVNTERKRGQHVASGFFSRNFSSNMYTLLAHGAVSITPSNKAEQRIISLTEFGRSEIKRLVPKAEQKRLRVEAEEQERALTEQNFRDWEKAHKKEKLVDEFKELGFEELESSSGHQPSASCPNLRCRSRRDANWGTLYRLSDGNMEVKIYSHTCGHQFEVKMDHVRKKKVQRVTDDDGNEI